METLYVEQCYLNKYKITWYAEYGISETKQEVFQTLAHSILSIQSIFKCCLNISLMFFFLVTCSENTAVNTVVTFLMEFTF